MKYNLIPSSYENDKTINEKHLKIIMFIVAASNNEEN